jgi:hypothetical protein
MDPPVSPFWAAQSQHSGLFGPRPLHPDSGTSPESAGSTSTWTKERMMSERELIDTGTDKRYVRRNEDGTFKESDDQGRSLSQDVKRKAKTKKPRNQGDKGD